MGRGARAAAPPARSRPSPAGRCRAARRRARRRRPAPAPPARRRRPGRRGRASRRTSASISAASSLSSTTRMRRGRRGPSPASARASVGRTAAAGPAMPAAAPRTRCPCPGRRCAPRRAAVQLDQAVHDREPEPEPALGARSSGCAPCDEQVEDAAAASPARCRCRCRARAAPPSSPSRAPRARVIVAAGLGVYLAALVSRLRDHLRQAVGVAVDRAGPCAARRASRLWLPLARAAGSPVSIARATTSASSTGSRSQLDLAAR